MIRKEVLEKIIYFTDEEIANLNGKKQIDRSVYVSENSNVVDASKLLKKHEHILVRKHARFLEYPAHSHNFIEMSYVYSGQITHVIDGTEIVLNKGEFILLDQNVEHAIKFAGENDIAFNFIILPDFIEYLTSLFEEENSISKFIFNSNYNYNNTGTYMVFRVSDSISIAAIMEELLEVVYSDSMFKDVSTKLVLGNLLIKLIEKQEKAFIENYDSYDSHNMYLINKYIKDNYKDANLEDLSEILHMNDYQICKYIKKKTNRTFKDLVQNMKMKRCELLLKTSDLTIAEIMENVGYENATYFYKVFKSYYGVTPKEYKKSNKSQ